MSIKRKEVEIPDCSAHMSAEVDFTVQDEALRKNSETEKVPCKLTGRQITLTFSVNGNVISKLGCEGCSYDRSY